jgi:hypothetical protein
MTTEYKTLRELDVRPGDVVENNVSGRQTVGTPYGTGFSYVNAKGESLGVLTSWRIISRAPSDETPKLWRDMTDAEKGALVLARYRGYVIAWWNDVEKQWSTKPVEYWADYVAYRVHDPKVETVTIYGRPDVEWVWDRCDYDTHRITFATIDGKPDASSIKMEEL